MQDYRKTNRLSLKTVLFFVVILFLAYLPISSFQFFLKNDAFNGYFPPKFFMSESIHAGYLPLWNPYINFGFPQYGDMSAGYWSPITWLVASSIGYNAYTLTIEALFYILLSGIGMYLLTGYWHLNYKVRIIAGIAFMCCGYHVGHLQHFNWLSGSAFLPFCCWSYLRLLKKPGLKLIILNALLFYMLLSSAHPGISIGAFYFFTAIFLFQFIRNKKKVLFKERLVSILKSHLALIAALFILSAGMIAGYTDIIPHFVRGEKLSYPVEVSNATSLGSWISLLLPFATVKNEAFFQSDLSLRDCYIGLPFLLFLLLAIVRKKTGWQLFLLVTGIVFTLISAGGFIKTIAYKFLPLLGYVRLNGEFRIFALIAFILVAAIELNKWLKEENAFKGPVKWTYYVLELVLFAAIIWGAYKAITEKNSIFYLLNNIDLQMGLPNKLKYLIDSISFYDTLWIQGCIQLFILWFLKFALIHKKTNWLIPVVAADLIIASLLVIPFTGAGKASLSKVQSLLNQSPKGIPIPVLQAINKNDSLAIADKDLLGNWSMYNKQIGNLTEVPYPIQLKNMKQFFENNKINPKAGYFNEAFLFLKNKKIGDSIIIIGYSPNKIEVFVHADNDKDLILQQNFYPHWYYQNAGISNPVKKAGVNFMRVPVNKGTNNMLLIFKPAHVKNAMLFSFIVLIIYLGLFIFLSVKTKTKV